MKKITALILVVVTAAMVLCGCAKVTNVSKINVYEYITLGDYENITAEDVRVEYDKERERLSETANQYKVGWGYTVQFNLKCEIKEESGNTISYTKYAPYCFEGENNTKTINIYEDTDDGYRALFDTAFIYDVKNASDSNVAATLRTITIGKAFDFEYDIPYKFENKDVAGKTLRFTVTPVKVLPAVYGDSAILESFNAFFNDYPASRETAGYGDSLVINVEGKVDGEIVEKYEQSKITLGYSSYPKEFDDALVGIKIGRTASFDITFPDDWTDSELAGLTVSYKVRLNEIYNYNKTVAEHTDYANLYELKEALRLEMFATDKLMYVVYARSTLNAQPKTLYKEYYDYFKSTNEENIIERAMKENGYTREEAVSIAFGGEAGYEAYLKGLTDDAVLQTLVCQAVADKLGFTYTDAMYKKDLKEFTDFRNAVYGNNDTTRDIEKQSQRNLLRQMFLESDINAELVKTITWLPVLTTETK